MSVPGTVLTKPDLALCPQLAGADITAQKANAPFAPLPAAARRDTAGSCAVFINRRDPVLIRPNVHEKESVPSTIQPDVVRHQRGAQSRPFSEPRDRTASGAGTSGRPSGSLPVQPARNML